MKRKREDIDAEEKKLSKLLFNKTEKFVQKLESSRELKNDESNQKPAWIDEDDNQFKINTVIPKVNNDGLYAEKLKQKYETLIGTPGWAKIKENDDEKESEKEVVRTVGHLEKKRVSKFDKKILEISKNTTITPQHKAITTSIKFHPKVSAVLLGNNYGLVTLNSLEQNNQLHNFKLKGWTISSTHFNEDGSEAYISGKKHVYCIYNLVQAKNRIVQFPQALKKAYLFELSPDGKYIAASECFSEVFLICAKSNELIKAFKNNSNVLSLTFSPDSKYLYCFNESCDVTIWDLQSQRSLSKFIDSGCITPSRIAVSHCGRLLATGTGEGIVNIYETDKLKTTEPVPLKTISHLTTKITNITFNPTSEMISISSGFLPNALKVVHIPSYHVFPNFPNKNLQQIETVGFSPNGGYMGVSNNKGVVNLFKLRHFRNY